MATRSVGFGENVTQLSAPQGAGAQPIQGVQTPTTNYTLPEGIMNIGLQVVKDIREGEIARTKEAKEAQKNQLIGNYVNAVNTLVSDGESSGMSPSEISARRRALGSQYAAQAAQMGIIEDLDKANRALSGLGEVGGIEDAAKQAADQRVKDVDFLRQRGRYVPPNASPDYIQSLLNNSAAIEFHEKNFEREQKEIAAARADTTYSQSQADRAAKESSKKALANIAATQTEATQIQLEKVVTDFRAGTIDIDQARQELSKSSVMINAVLNQVAIANPELVSPIRQNFDRMHELQMKRLTSPSEDLELEYKALVNKNMLIAVQRTPQALQAVVASKLLGPTITGTLLANDLAKQVLPLMMTTDTTQNNTVTNVVGSGADKEAEQTVYTVANKGLSMVRDGQIPDPAAKKEAFQLANNILDQLGDKTGNNKLKPEDLKDVTDFIAGESFAYFVKEGGLNATVASQAKKAYTQLYATAIDGTIRSKLQEEIPMGTREQALGKRAVARGEAPEVDRMTTMDLVDISFVGGAAQFIPRMNTGIEEMTSSKKAIMQEKVRELRSYQNLLNKTIRAGAHLEGTTDYQAYWEKNKSAILPFYYTNEQYPIGVVVDGYRLKAYPYNKKSNWEKVDGGE